MTPEQRAANTKRSKQYCSHKTLLARKPKTVQYSYVCPHDIDHKGEQYCVTCLNDVFTQ